jgi:hypothetical protein
MTNEIQADVTTAENGNAVVTDNQTPNENQDTVSSKTETPEAKKARIEGSFKRFAKDLEDMGVDPKSFFEKPETKSKSKQKQSEPDYGQLAYLEAKGIPEDDHEWLFERATDMKVEIKDLLSKDWVKSELKERKAKRDTTQAIPKGTSRSSVPSGDEFETALAEYQRSGKLPDSTELKRKIVNHRMKQEGSSRQFYNQG